MLRELFNDAEAIIEQVYGEDMPLPPPMYNYQPLAYEIVINPRNGEADLQQLPQADVKKGEMPRADCLPYLGRTSAPVAIALVDKPAYVLGITDGKEPKTAENRERFALFKNCVRACREATGLTDLDLVLTFLEGWNPDAPGFTIPPDLRSNDLIGFRLYRKLERLSDHPDVQRFWSETTRGAETRRLTCLVTGKEAAIETKLPLGIKNVPGGQSSGAALSSFNENAYMSYGLQEFSAPISRDAGEQVGKALNALLLSPRHSTLVGPYDTGIRYAYWCPSAEIRVPMFDNSPEPEVVKQLVEAGDQEILGKILIAPREGKPIVHIADNAPFHILGVASHSGGRVAIRSALSLTVGELFQKQRDWFRRLQIVDRQGRPGSPRGIPALVLSAYRDKKDAPKHLYDALVQTALNNVSPPVTLLPVVVRRCQIGSEIPAGKEKRREHVTYTRAMLLKFLLTWNESEEKQAKMSDLDTETTDTAYRCGRLLYHLERIQYLAVGKVNATLVDRYYGGASTTPKTVFPPLIRLANQAHMKAIRRDRGAGVANSLQNEMAEIMSKMGEAFPAYLSLEQQGRFALGYYFQRAKVNRLIAEAKARKAAGETLPDTAAALAGEAELPVDDGDDNE